MQRHKADSEEKSRWQQREADDDQLTEHQEEPLARDLEALRTVGPHLEPAGKEQRRGIRDEQGERVPKRHEQRRRQNPGLRNLRPACGRPGGEQQRGEQDEQEPLHHRENDHGRGHFASDDLPAAQGKQLQHVH